jgi:hypothetical protein
MASKSSRRAWSGIEDAVIATCMWALGVSRYVKAASIPTDVPWCPLVS